MLQAQQDEGRDCSQDPWSNAGLFWADLSYVSQGTQYSSQEMPTSSKIIHTAVPLVCNGPCFQRTAYRTRRLHRDGRSRAPPRRNTSTRCPTGYQRKYPPSLCRSPSTSVERDNRRHGRPCKGAGGLIFLPSPVYTHTGQRPHVGLPLRSRKVEQHRFGASGVRPSY